MEELGYIKKFIPIFAGLLAMGIAPFMLLMVSSFVKIVVVFSLLRNALGLQQTPPNIVLNGLALVLTFYVMYPVVDESVQIVAERSPDTTQISELKGAMIEGIQPLKKFMQNHTNPENQEVFLRIATRIWPSEKAIEAQKDDFFILMPAFIISELISAFEIGFILFIPFVIIDFIVSGLLLAMGMMMMSPMTISLPLKILLFVMINGWSRLIEGLLLTYQI